MKLILRKTAAFLIAPTLTALCLAIVFEALYPSDTSLLDLSIQVVFGLIPLTYLFVIIFGYPGISFLKKRDKLSVLWITLVGFFSGLTAFLIIDTVLLISFMNTSFPLNPLFQEESIAEAANLSFGPLLTNRILLFPITGLCAALGAFIYSLISGITNYEPIFKQK